MFSPRRVVGSALCVSFVLALYWQAASGAGYFFERDVWLYWIPHIEWAVRVMAEGRLPQWNPFIGFGAPFMADPSFQFFYPPSLLNWILPAPVAYSVLVVGHSIFGSLGAFRLLRGRLRSTGAALLGTVCFVAAGPLVSSANLWHHFAAAMYMPWVVDAFLELRSGRGSIARLGLLTGLQALTGSADVCLMTGLSLVVLLPARGRRLKTLVPRLTGALALCLSLAAVQWLPALLLARDASRASLDPVTRLHWSVQPASLIDLVLPLSGAAHATPGPDFIEERLRLIPWMYLGASTLPLLVLGARRAPRTAWLLLFSIVLSLGRHTPLGEWFSGLPLVSSFRFPAKLLWLVSFAWAILAAIGFKELARRENDRRAPVMAVALVLLVAALAALLVKPVTPIDHPDWQEIWNLLPFAPLALGGALLALSFGPRARWALALIVAVDLIGLGQTFNNYSSGEMFGLRPALVDQLRSLNTSRIYVLQKSRSESGSWRSPAGWTPSEAYYFGQGQFLSPPQSMRWSIKGSFDGDFTGLARRDYAALCSLMGASEPMNERLLQLAGVTHVMRFQGASPPEFPAAAEVETFHDRPVLVLRVPDPFPPAYVVHRVRGEVDQANALQALLDPAFDPSREIVRMGPAGPAAPSLPAAPPTAPDTARIMSETEGRTRIEAHLFEAGTVVVLNAFSAGWHARVDGRPAEVRPANLVFQSVDLDAGDHLIDLDYETPGLRLGLLASLLGWAWLAKRALLARRATPFA